MIKKTENQKAGSVFGGRLQYARQEILGWGRAEMARALGLPNQDALKKVEHRDKHKSIDLLRRACAVTGLDPIFFISSPGEQNVHEYNHGETSIRRDLLRVFEKLPTTAHKVRAVRLLEQALKEAEHDERQPKSEQQPKQPQQKKKKGTKKTGRSQT